MNVKLMITPRDLLFFRDAKPMAAGEGYGNGCNMPTPNILHSAIRTALLRQCGALPDRKTVSTHSMDRGKNRKIGTDKFGSLQVKNLFPYHEKHGTLFQIPNDVLKADKNNLAITQLRKISDDLICPFTTIPPCKERVSGFWTETQLLAYMSNQQDDHQQKNDFTPITQSDIWKEEWRVGIEIDSERNSTKAGQLYAGGYMRLNDCAGFVAEVSIKDDEGDLTTLNHLHFGGEKKLATVEIIQNCFPEWETTEAANGKIVKWILLTPAIFANGALPGWIENGKVLLQPKIDGKKATIAANLLCCSVGNPKPLSGWDSIDQQAKPSLFAVQAGAVYYFECTTKEDAKKLSAALLAKNRSDMLSEQGFGFGITTIMEKNYE